MAKQSRGDQVFDAVNTTLLAGILMIVLYPLIFVLSSSISDPMSVMQGKVWLWPKEVNMDAYLRVFRNSDILTGYRNTLIYTSIGTMINVAMTTMAAYPLSRKDFLGKNWMMLVIVFTMFFHGGLIPTYLVIKQLGMLNTFWVMVIPGAVSAWNLIIMRTFFQTTIPVELQESAFIDGYSNIRVLIRVVLPLSLPIIAVMCLYYAVWHWNSFFNALIYLSDREAYPLQLFIREILVQNQMEAMMELSTESIDQQVMLAESIKYAVIIVSSLPVLLLYPLLQKYFVKGVMIGAIKG